MTEKRFTFADGFKIVAVRDNGEIMNSVKVVDMLNTLNDESEELKTKNFAYLQDIEVFKEEITHLKLENEELKQLLDYADDLIQSYMSVHNRDEWENVKKNITGDVK